MNDQFASSTAMVKASETIDELVAAGKAINEAINRGERLNLEKFLELGKIVNKLKETCQHGEFTPACSKMGLSQQRASECGRAAKLPAPVLLQCNSIKEAIEASRDKPPDPVVSHDLPESEGNNGEAIEAAWDKPPDPVVSSDPPESEGSNGTVSPDHQVPLNGFFDIPRAGPKTEPPPASASPSLLCRDCRIHKPKSNCKRCAELRKPHRQLAAREPGEDDDTYGNPVAKKVKTHQERLGKLIDVIKTKHDVTTADAEGKRKTMDNSLNGIIQLSEAPLRPVPPLRDGKCKYCQAPIKWATKENGKKVPLDPERTVNGQYDLDGGLAIRAKAEWARTDQPKLYQSHCVTCPSQPKQWPRKRA